MNGAISRMETLLRIILAAAFLSPLAAMGDTANELIPKCGKDSPLQMYCIGYMQGALDTQNSLSWLTHKRKPYCLPDKNTLGQDIAVFLKYAADHPADTHYPADQLIFAAMFDAFPCSGQ